MIEINKKSNLVTMTLKEYRQLLRNRREAWSEDEEEYLIAAYEDSESSIEEIADFLGRSYIAVIQHTRSLKKSGLIQNKRIGGWTDSEIGKLKRYHGRLSYAELSEILGRSEKAISKQVYKLGLGKVKPVDIDLVKDLASQGLTRHRIANRLDVSYWTICKIIRQNKIEVVDEENHFRSNHQDFLTKTFHNH